MSSTPAKLEEVLQGIQPIDLKLQEKAREHTAQLIMPPRSLGLLHDIAERLCAIRKTEHPSVDKKAILVMAADHGVANSGVSAFPQVVTVEMIRAFLRGGGGINVLSRHAGAEVHVVDVGVAADIPLDGLPEESLPFFSVNKVAYGTANLAEGPAMTREQAEQSIMAGFAKASKCIADGVDILGTGDMGIANTTASAAIGACITEEDPERMVGPGTGVVGSALDLKLQIVKNATDCNQPDAPDRTDALDVLSKVGGFEIGAIAGTILAGAYYGIPVVVDGFISSAGALIALTLCPQAVDYIFAGHCSEEPGHRAMLYHMGLTPILDLGLRLGEGTGAVMAMTIIESATRIHNEMMTFEQAGVTSG